MTTILPLRVFVGSSTPHKQTASRLTDALARHMYPYPWWEQFPPGDTTLGSLLEITQRMDLAIFIIGKDDLRWKNCEKANESFVTRDNVIYELGLFAGALGGKRSIMFVDSFQVPDKPTDLSGVTEIRWDSRDDSSFSEAVADVCSHAKRIFDELGLGWWTIRFDNDKVPGRATYGVFELFTKATVLNARYGNTYYSESERTMVVSHQLRSTWDSSSVSFSRNAEGTARLIVLTNGFSEAPPNDPEEYARKTTSIRAVFELHQTEDKDFFRGKYFDIEGIEYFGRVSAQRLGKCSKTAAERKAKKHFGGSLRP